MKKSIYLVFLILSLSVLFAQTATPPAAGNGTESDPYQIATLDNLYWIMADSANSDYHYIQIADINAAETATWFPKDTGGFYGWTPIRLFDGSYDGQGHVIDSLYVSRNINFVGFFGGTSNSFVSNLGLTNVQITGNSFVGGLIGFCNDTPVNYCYVTGTVTGTGDFIGGLIGSNGTIGVNGYSEINYCYTDISVQGYRWIGGLVGGNHDTPVSNCYSNGFVSTKGFSCGGLIGSNLNPPFHDIIFSRPDSTVRFCYSTCLINGVEGIGGLIGHNSIYTYKVNSSFWDMETSGLDSSAGGSGRTTVEMKTQSTYTDSGWNFTDVWMIDPAYNNGYPVLRWHPGVGVKEEILPESAFLHQNYPNPLNPTTTISYELPEAQNITLQIYDITGRLVKTLYDGYKEAGHWEINWDASNQSSGVYIYRLRYGNQYISRKMLLLK